MILAGVETQQDVERERAERVNTHVKTLTHTFTHTCAHTRTCENVLQYVLLTIGTM